MKFVVQWMMKQQGHLIAASTTQYEVLETIMEVTNIQPGKKDYTAMERRCSYEDFIEMIAKLATSIYWIHGQAKPEDDASSNNNDTNNNQNEEAMKALAISESKESGLQQESTMSLASSEVGAIDMYAKLFAWLNTLE